MYTSIVVGTDGSTPARAAVEHAATLAKATGAVLHLVHAYRLPSRAALVAPELATVVAGADGDAADAARQMVDAAVAELRQGGLVEVKGHTCPGSAADALCSVAEAEGADVIVVGNKGMRGARRVLGSVPNSVAHGATCGVLIVPTV